ncbi:MAG: HAD-IA family hydrolase [Sphingomonadaceae bacterium]|nr:HAD-IA family hydrolase [Sphingomonadaceae bacterium]
MAYTTVIFDFGGVITSSPFEAFNRLEAERGLPRDFVRRVNSTNPHDNAWAKFERAECTAVEFDALFAAEAMAMGHSLDGASVISCLAGDIRPEMVAALDRLKVQGFMLGCITNNVRAGRGSAMAADGEKARAVEAIMARFDHVVESSKVGIRKPDPRIYTMMCDALGVVPTDCVYLDDLGINCKPAATLGMAAIKVTSGEQAIMELSNLLNMDFSRP